MSPKQILQPHREATQRRICQQPVVLIVQDTTVLDYSKHPPDDARCLDKIDRFGLYLHAHLAVTPHKLCLGVVEAELFDRTPESLGQSKQRKKLPIEEKESFRWLKGYQEACQFAADCPETQIVSIADCEADIYDIFVDAQKQTGRRADYIIRTQEDRCTPERDPETGPNVYCKVRDEVKCSKLRTTRTIELCQTPKRAARQAALEIRAITVTVKPPQARPKMGSVIYNVVLVEEVGGPGDGTDVLWLLITTLPIETIDDILRVVDYYVARWALNYFSNGSSRTCESKRSMEPAKMR